jgi:hypothetical protein
MYDWEWHAQRAGERRLMSANDDLWAEDNGEVFDGEDETDGPYCGCDTCVVREVLSAAWPYMYRLAHEPDVDVPEVPVDVE